LANHGTNSVSKALVDLFQDIGLNLTNFNTSMIAQAFVMKLIVIQLNGMRLKQGENSSHNTQKNIHLTIPFLLIGTSRQ
jgi:hypothetical protein